MTSVLYDMTDGKVNFCIVGHCNAGRINGYDLCCCAVSMLVYTLMDNLDSLNLESYRADYCGGWCAIEFALESEDKNKAIIILTAVLRGFRLLEKKYPQNIKIIVNADMEGDNIEDV